MTSSSEDGEEEEDEEELLLDMELSLDPEASWRCPSRLPLNSVIIIWYAWCVPFLGNKGI